MSFLISLEAAGSSRTEEPSVAPAWGRP